jgi:hypothetical protein
LADLNPIAGQRGTTKHTFHNTKIFPGFFAINFREGFKADVLPRSNEDLDVSAAHGAIAKQMLVMPNAPSDKPSMIGQTFLPPAWILFFDRFALNDEINEFECNGAAGAAGSCAYLSPCTSSRQNGD